MTIMDYVEGAEDYSFFRALYDHEINVERVFLKFS